VSGEAPPPRHWCVTTSPANLARTAALGWTVQGLKSRRGPTARSLRPGDSLTYYVTGAKAFGAVVEVTGAAFESHEPVWVARQEGEDYPWRFLIRHVAGSAEPAHWVEVEDVLDGLEHPRRWPRERWHLAFQGNIREWPDADAALVRSALNASTVRGR
jgi:hypothetical protein